jgi:hypothetical protein
MPKILIVHGISHIEADSQWREKMSGALADALRKVDANASVTFTYFAYDDIFNKAPFDMKIVGDALHDLLKGLFWHGIGDLFHRPRDLFGGIESTLRWTAGMVAQWAAETSLRSNLRVALAKQILADAPDVVVAHSMGSILCYDLFTEQSVPVNGDTPGSEFIKGRYFVTLGCQIQNPALRDLFGGHLSHLDTARHWFNLYNPLDRVLVVPITLQYPGFDQIRVPFDNHDMMNHAWERYVNEPGALENVWRPILTPNVASLQDGKASALTQSFKAGRARGLATTVPAYKTPTKRALLIGINDYPDPRNQLDGCVNDVFRVSATLQECGFDPEDIRVVFNARATADGIRERLTWLFDGVDGADERVLFYSGHGAQIPTYGPSGEIESYYETLVPFDFDFTPGRCITDADLHDLYSNLPYEAQFMMLLDCCHSGGLSRDGSAKVRGITPPDDIRHRSLKWDMNAQMWTERKLPELLKYTPNKDRDGYIGSSGAVYRLGRGTALRSTTLAEHKKRTEAKGTMGPFLPLIITACQEQQFSYEYRDGVTSYGAFTYALTNALRRERDGKSNPTFSQLVKRTAGLLKDLKYDQSPDIVGPKKVVNAEVPWCKQ